MTMKNRRTSLKASSRTSLSPPVWKEQLKERCMERLRQDRHKLLAKLRSPDGKASITDEMKRLVDKEGRRDKRDAKPPTTRSQLSRHPVFDFQNESDDHDSINVLADSSIDDLMAMGKLSEKEYLELVHSLEDALVAEMYLEAEEEEEHLAEEMVEFEEASLEAMLAGMDLDAMDDEYYDYGMDDVGPCTSGISVLCPICKKGTLREHASTTPPSLSCSCGFTFKMKEIFHGVLEDFQEKVVSAFMTHRENCYSDPSFEKATAHDQFQNSFDAIRIVCRDCHYDQIIL